MSQATTSRKRGALEVLRALSQPKVAVMLAQPEGTVKSRIRSGLKRMRDELAESGVGGGGTS